MADLKKLTILHSNDLHGDFLAENVDENLIGGVSMLSGYVNKVRSEDPNALYVIAGDMFRGSIIDAEFQGVSTIEIMNYLAPDMVSLGNHEIDYGIAHLLFLEKCCKFPIINSNLYIKTNGMRMFNSHKILKINGMNILFIGIITEDIMAAAKGDGLLGTFVNVNEAANEVGKICNNYKTVDIDFTILMTHIGYEEDKKLASLLLPEWGVDVIIGGHSHTILDKPAEVNNVLIVQAGKGTDQIGRFDFVVNADTNSVESYTWQLVPIDASHCPRDTGLEDVINYYKEQTDRKYKRIITHFPRRLTHPKRNRETEIGNLFADAFTESLGVDIMLVGSGSIRNPRLGPTVEFGDLKEIFPYDDSIWSFKLTGKQLRTMFLHIFRDDAFTDETEFYQAPASLKLDYSYPDKKFNSFTMYGKEVEDGDIYNVALQRFHFTNLDAFFNLKQDEVEANGKAKQVSTSCYDILEEYLSLHNNLQRSVEGRLHVTDGPNNYPNDIK